jgi:hypothetical protein
MAGRTEGVLFRALVGGRKNPSDDAVADYPKLSSLTVCVAYVQAELLAGARA